MRPQLLYERGKENGKGAGAGILMHLLENIGFGSTREKHLKLEQTLVFLFFLSNSLRMVSPKSHEESMQ